MLQLGVISIVDEFDQNKKLRITSSDDVESLNYNVTTQFRKSQGFFNSKIPSLSTILISFHLWWIWACALYPFSISLISIILHRRNLFSFQNDWFIQDGCDILPLITVSSAKCHYRILKKKQTMTIIMTWKFGNMPYKNEANNCLLY